MVDIPKQYRSKKGNEAEYNVQPLPGLQCRCLDMEDAKRDEP